MAVKTTLENVVPTQDGRFDCYDAVVTGHDIATLYKTGFLKLDPEHQRGEDTLTRKPILDKEKIERWADQLTQGQAYLGQLSWNFREGETTLDYDPGSRTLTVGAGAATIPDSFHRHMAILKAVESAARGSGFDPTKRMFSVRIYHVPIEEENRIFYAMNQEGKKADPTRSKWLHRVGVTKLAAALVERSEHLKDNVDTVRDRLSKKNPRLFAFNTLSHAFEEHWPTAKDATMAADVDYLVRFWDKLVEVRPELGKLDISDRKIVREKSLVDSAVAIMAYIALAHRMREQGIGLAALEKLRPQERNGVEVDFFARTNPIWQQVGVLVPRVNKKGVTTLNLRNARQSRDAMLTKIAELLGVRLGKESAQREPVAAGA